jgi:CheY-like chemotaxis protein
LLEVSRINHGTLELRPERVDLNAIVEHALETSEPLIQTRGHRLHVALPGRELWVDGDPIRLAQVVANLLSNAAKYTDPGGDIWLTVARVDTEAVITVRDNGAGIAASALPRVFDLFHRGDRLVDGTGLGIGLTLARNLVQMHGGRIVAQSDGAGKGSEFTVGLPLTVSQEPATQRERRISRHLAPLRVLIVDDNQDAADSLQALLRLLGADAEVARDGHKALDAVTQYRPTVVLLDIGLPGMNGYEVARWIRARRDIQQPTIVAITGWGQPEDRRRAQEAGFDHHLIKPADLVALQGILNSLRVDAHV